MDYDKIKIHAIKAKVDSIDMMAELESAEKEKMAGMGMQFLFAGTEKSDPTKLHTVIKFEGVEAMQAFGADKELTETRRQAGAVIESGVMTIISNEFFTNYPDTFIQH